MKLSKPKKMNRLRVFSDAKSGDQTFDTNLTDAKSGQDFGGINVSETEYSEVTAYSTPGSGKSFINDYFLIYKRPAIQSILSSFSLQVNLRRLTSSRVCFDENDELEVIEGFRVLTMFWGIACAASLYVLTAHVDNILYMLHLFKSITFTMVASGNLAPNLFIFFIAFMSFYKINKLADLRGGISIGTYVELVVYRWLKYIPVFWFVFIFSWVVLPYISNAPTWYLSETLFQNCSSHWWSTLLFFNNLYPWFVEALAGCFQWPFVVMIDLQLYFFLPLIVIVYRKNKIIFHILMAFVAAVGAAVLFYIFWHHNLSVGALTLENFYLYSINFNKPWTKFPSYSLGCWMGAFYLNVLEYRKTKNEVDKQRNHRVIHLLHTSVILKIALGVYSIVALNLTTLSPFEVNKDGYAWNRAKNSFYNSLCQFGYVSSVMVILALIFCGQLKIIKSLMTLKIWRPLSKLTLGTYLLYPIVLMMIYVGANNSVVLGLFNIVIIVIYAIVASYFFSLVVYLLIQDKILLVLYSKIRKFDTKSLFEINERVKEESRIIEKNEKDQ
jgi:hypothetical protein